MKKNLKYSEYSTVKNSTENLKSLRDDDAIDFFETLTKIEGAFKPVQDAVDSMLRQVQEINEELAVKNEAIEKKYNGKPHKIEEEQLLVQREYKPQEREFNRELDKLRDKEKEVEFKPLEKETLKKYGLLTLENLELFKSILK